MPLYSYLPSKREQILPHAVAVRSHVVLPVLLARHFAVAAVHAQELFLMEGELLAQRDRLCLVAADVFHDSQHVGRLGGGRGGKSGENGDQLHFGLHQLDTPHPGGGMHYCLASVK